MRTTNLLLAGWCALGFGRNGTPLGLNTVDCVGCFACAFGGSGCVGCIACVACVASPPRPFPTRVRSGWSGAGRSKVTDVAFVASRPLPTRVRRRGGWRGAGGSKAVKSARVAVRYIGRGMSRGLRVSACRSIEVHTHRAM